VRADFIHKLTTRLCRENQAVVIEDLNVSGMLANGRLARAIADVGFHEIRRQLAYKAARYGTTVVLADCWYPSSKLCSSCGTRHGALALGERAWTCDGCGAHHDRDVNAAINLQRLATGALAARSALPVASPAVTPGTAAGDGPAGGREVTPVRYEFGQQDDSGQEENAAYLCARSDSSFSSTCWKFKCSAGQRGPSRSTAASSRFIATAKRTLGCRCPTVAIHPAHAISLPFLD
jgi:putative transposase